MKKSEVIGAVGTGAHSDSNPATPSLTAARTAPVAQADGGQEGVETSVSGSPPSIRDPDNSNQQQNGFFKALRWGVDSLYLSYPGTLFADTDARLRSLKALAQSENPDDVGKAQLPLGSHVFEVKNKGTSLFSYILEDGAFRIQLSQPPRKPGNHAPMAYVKISAAYLAHVGPVDAEKHLLSLLSELGEIKEAANVSRIDLYVDFVSSVDMESWDRQAWVTRAASINTYSSLGRFTGWSIGLGAILSARLYNKVLEIVVSKKDWILELWQKAGWQPGETVWRLEFELKREVLTQKGLSKLSEVLSHLNGLWSYATTDWLRLTLPNSEDKTRSRWPIHPLWGFLSSIDWESKGGPLSKRFSPTRSPKDDKLFQMAGSVMLSFLAKHGYAANEAYEGSQDFIAQLLEYLDKRAYGQGLSFDNFVAEQLALKHRQYNTALNHPEQEAERQAQAIADQAKAYRKESGG